jgi:hypothetical protein
MFTSLLTKDGAAVVVLLHHNPDSASAAS